MQGIFSFDPSYEIYKMLDNKISIDLVKETLDHSKLKPLDQLLKLILLNNGCSDIENKEALYESVNGFDEGHNIYFVYNMMGNKVNEFYDFVNFNGSNILIIFLDYFKKCIKINYNVNEDIIGNSIAYDAISKLVDVIYSTFTFYPPSSQYLLKSAMNITKTWNCKIIALHIINKFSKITENDVCDISISDIEKILSSNIQLALYGCRQIDNLL